MVRLLSLPSHYIISKPAATHLGVGFRHSAFVIHLAFGLWILFGIWPLDFGIIQVLGFDILQDLNR
jgi:hypothetical protein